MTTESNPQPPRFNLRLLQFTIIAGAVFIAGLAIYYYLDAKSFLNGAQVVTGTFQELRSRENRGKNGPRQVHDSRIEFRDQAGVIQNEWVPGNFSSSSGPIEILFNPNHSQRTVVRASYSPWLIPWVLLLVAVIEIVVVLPVLTSVFKKKRGEWDTHQI